MLMELPRQWDQPEHLPTMAHRILEALRHPVLVVDRLGVIAYANAAALVDLGDWIAGYSLMDVFPGYLRSSIEDLEMFDMRLTTAQEASFDAIFNAIDDHWISVSLRPISAVSRLVDGFETDDLTGLLLRKAFMTALSQQLALCDEQPHCLAVHCLDLDRFKIINDTLGHEFGDRLLRKVADRLRTACRKSDIIARLGGDEFVILQLGIAGPEEAQQLANRLVDLVGRTYVLNGHSVNIGVSVGVTLNEGRTQAAEVLRDADLALYEAKRAGRSRHRFFEPGMDAYLLRRRDLEIDLRRAVALKQFELYYQPFFDLNADTIAGFEALLRWNRPDRGQVPPLEFIPVAEENGLIVPIGEWVLRTACMAAASWPDDMVLAVNVSPIQFRSDTLLATVATALRRSGLAPQRLELEITETALLENTASVLSTLHALRELGVKISMDDFGTGYSSLSYLQKFPFSKIKIDRSFVANADPDSRAILNAVAALGSNLGMEITAEGVETAEQLQRIRQHNCTHVQGFYTGRPITADEVHGFMVRHRTGEPA